MMLTKTAPSTSISRYTKAVLLPFVLAPRALNITIEDSFGWPYETEGIWFDNYGSKDFFGPAKTLESNVKKLHVELFDQTEYEVPENIVTISNEIIERTGVGKEAQTNEEEGE